MIAQRRHQVGEHTLYLRISSFAVKLSGLSSTSCPLFREHLGEELGKIDLDLISDKAIPTPRCGHIFETNARC